MARSGIIYGETSCYKTTAVAHFSRWIAETTGRATLLFSSDGGGWEAAEEEVRAGMIIPYHCDSNIIPLPVIRKISQGYWPENPLEHDMSRVNFTRVDWSQVGGIAVEGITSLGAMLLRHCADRNLKTGQEGTSAFVQQIVVDGVVANETFAQNSKAHFGFVQNQLVSLVNNFTSLPVAYVLFTGHEKRYAEDGELQVGIQAPGKALNSILPPMFGDMIHAQDWHSEEVRYWIRKHRDEQLGVTFNAKPRVTHSQVGALAAVYPLGYFVPTPEHGFDDYLRVTERLAADAARSRELDGWRERMRARLAGKTGGSEVAAAEAGK
jgi:hypothetical protein